MGLVLKADCAAGDAFVTKNLSLAAAWTVQFDLYVPTSTFTVLHAASDSSTAAFPGLWCSDGINVDAGFLSVPLSGWVTFGGSGGAGSFTPDSWLRSVVVAYDGSDNITWTMGGSLLFSYNEVTDDGFSLNPLDHLNIGGEFSNSVSGEVYYFDNVEVFDHSSTLVFSDDFESGGLTAWDSTTGAVSVVTDPAGGGGATNVTQADAIALTGVCSEGTISNAGATDTLAADDPFNTVYSMGGTFSRQVWWKLTNTTGSQAYARFILKNTSVSPIDIAAAIYIDDPATVPIDPNRSVNFVESWQIPLGSGGSFALGTALADSSTVWLEIGGDDTEGDGHGWNGNLDLTWELLGATFKDTPDAGMEGTTEYRADLQGATRADSLPLPTSYCKCGDLHFAAVNQADNAGGGHGVDTDLRVWVWSDSGGAATDYNITDMTSGEPGLRSNPQLPTNTGVPLLRTDGTNVWLITYELFAGAVIHCNGSDHETGDTISPSVLVWNGSGFTYLGNDGSQTFPWNNDPSGIHYGQIVGQLTAAASSAETGVLHVMWSEGGPKEINPADCSITAFAERVGYSQWSPTTEVVTQADVLSSSGGDPSTLTPVVSQYLFATNAFGTLKAFYGPPATVDIIADFLNITYGTTVEMWSINESTGAPTVLQTIDGTTLNPAVINLDSTGASTIGGTRLPPQSMYAGADTFFFVAPWRENVGPSFYAPLLFVPADGSSPIAKVPASVGGVGAIPSGGSIQDAYDDGSNIWVGTGSLEQGGNAIVSGSLTCTTGTSGYIADGDGSRYITPGGLEFQYDDSAGCFYTLGMNAAIQQSTTEYAPLKIPILRDYLTCSISSCVTADGLHVWQRF